MQPRLAHPIPVGLLGDDLAGQKARDDVDRVRHAVALGLGIDAEHHRIRWQEAWPKAEHRPAARLVVELNDAVGHHQGMVVGQRDDPGAEPDVPGALGRGGDEQFGLPVDLIAARMVLADPRLGKAELVEPRHQLEIALHAEQRVLVVGMERRQEYPRAKCAKLGHAAPPVNKLGRDTTGCSSAARIFPPARLGGSDATWTARIPDGYGSRATWSDHDRHIAHGRWPMPSDESHSDGAAAWSQAVARDQAVRRAGPESPPPLIRVPEHLEP